MNQIYTELSNTYPKLTYLQIQAEEYPDLSESSQIDSVPTFIFYSLGKEIDRISGADAPSLTALIEKYSTLQPTIAPTLVENTPLNIENKLYNLIHSHPVMIFIKGTPQAPKCGFSNTAVSLLKDLDCSFGSFDILQDEQVRSALKKYSDWPTYPQIYIRGELIGGVDILKEMIQSGEFQKIMPVDSNDVQMDLNERIKQLIHKDSLVLFMKGDRVTPQCGFSRQIITLLKDLDLEFTTFDILQDEEVRQGLKEYSQWPTYPQLYYKGEFLGGLDIVREMIESGEFQSMMSQ